MYILIIDENPQRRQQLASILDQDADMSVVGLESEIPSDFTTHPLLEELDVLLISVVKPELRELRTWARLRAHLPKHVPIAALVFRHDIRALEASLAAGVLALQPIDLPPVDLRLALRAVAEGKLAYHRDLVDEAKVHLLPNSADKNALRIGGLMVDFNKQLVSRWGTEVKLSPLEYRLLTYLSRNQGRFCSTRELLRSIWGTSYDEGGTDDQVRSTVKRLRAKLEPKPHAPRYILSTPGKGYILRSPLQD